ncbi:hypothetical protein BBJ28_00004560 [Nothophytophthora sp. Chile5]|nr:hypothetical protein BBJ28_00004560 [Nothophytophthora sp. Chile5]
MKKDYQQAPDEDVAAAASRLPPPTPAMTLGAQEKRRSAVICTVLAICASLVAVSWLVAISTVFNAHTLASAGFAPFGKSVVQDVYVSLAYIFVVVAVLVTIAVNILVCRAVSLRRALALSVLWRVLLVSVGCFLAALVAVNVDAFGYGDRVTSREVEFREKFNDFFCDLRVTQVCADEGEYSKLLEMFSAVETDGSSTNKTSGTSSSSASERVWRNCRAELVDHNGSLLMSQLAFLGSCNTTDTVDNWCGNYTMGVSSNASSPLSPFSVNPGKYRSFQTEWPKRVRLDTFYLGIVLVCLLLLCFSMRTIKDDGRAARAGFELVEVKSTVAARDNAAGIQSRTLR